MRTVLALSLSALLFTMVRTSTKPTVAPPAESSPVCSQSQAATLALDGFHGYCKCSCSAVPNCNTSADCGGGACTNTKSCC